jgi:hypothetical protein
MPSADRIGKQSGPYLVRGPVIEDNGRAGVLTTYYYEGSESECRTQYAFDKLAGASRLMLAQKGDGNWTLSVSYPFGENGEVADPPTDTHELEVNSLQPSVWENTLLRATFTEATLAKVQQFVRDWESGKYGTDSSAAVSDITAATGAEATVAVAWWKHVALHDIKSFSEEHWVYRRTITAATPRQITASFVGVGKIWTTGEVIAQEGLPAAWYFVLPTTSVWLRTRPRVTVVARGKTQISYQYTEAIGASSFLYDKQGSAVLSDYIWVAP